MARLRWLASGGTKTSSQKMMLWFVKQQQPYCQIMSRRPAPRTQEPPIFRPPPPPPPLVTNDACLESVVVQLILTLFRMMGFDVDIPIIRILSR